MNELMKLKEHHYTHTELEVSDIQRREIAFAYQGDEGIKGRAKYFQSIEDLRESTSCVSRQSKRFMPALLTILTRI